MSHRVRSRCYLVDRQLKKLGMVRHSIDQQVTNSPDFLSQTNQNTQQFIQGVRWQMDYTYKMTLKDDAKPFAISTPRGIPLPLYEGTNKELDRMLQMLEISKEDTPTE